MAGVHICDTPRGRDATIEHAVHLSSASRYLEWIVNLATNIAQDVVYMVEGELIRHRDEDGSKDAREGGR